MVRFTELKNRNFSVICGDPGGTVVIKNFLNQRKFLPNKMILSNVSRRILGKKFIKLEEKNRKKFLSSSNIFITSTSWKSKLELNFISKNIKKQEIRIISFLDSWFNYKKRFKLKNKYHYPHEIWTFDKYAFQIAKKVFKGKAKIKQERLITKDNFFKISSKKNNNILYLTEPISELAKSMYGSKKYFNYDEVKALDLFLGKINFLFKNISLITIRVHPNEKLKKYKRILKKYKNLPLKVSENSLQSDLRQNHNIIGTVSSVLFIALQKNKKVFTILGKNNSFFKIPFKKLRYLGIA